MLVRIVLFACVSAFLFGYDLGLIGGAILHIQEEYGTSTGVEEAIVGSAKLGAVFGTLLGGALMLHYGRRPAIAIDSLFFAIGPIIMAAGWNVACIIVGRFIIGIGIGISAVVVPAYLGEVAPAAIRGRVVEMYEVMLCVGMLAAALADVALDGVPGNWRWMVGLPLVPAIIMSFALCVLPESPRWLITQGDLDSALAVIHKIYTSKALPVGVQESTAEVEAELMDLWSAVEKDRYEGLQRRQQHAARKMTTGRRSSRGRQQHTHMSSVSSPLGGGGVEENGRPYFSSSGNNDDYDNDEGGVGGYSNIQQQQQRQQHEEGQQRLGGGGGGSNNNNGDDDGDLTLHRLSSLPPIRTKSVPDNDDARGLLAGSNAAMLSDNTQHLRQQIDSTNNNTTNSETDAKEKLSPVSLRSPTQPENNGEGGSGYNSSRGGVNFNDTTTTATTSTGVNNNNNSSTYQRQPFEVHSSTGGFKDQNQHYTSHTKKQGFWRTAYEMILDTVIVAQGPERRAFRMALILAFFNQAFASTAIINYAPRVLEHAGIESNASATLFSSLIGLSKLVGVVAALFLVDSVGRRPLLAVGSLGCSVALAVLIPADWLDLHWLLIFAMCLFIFSFSISWAGVFWVLISEIFSMGAKSPAAAAATAVLFLTGAVADLCFLSLHELIGPFSFLVYSLIALAAAVYVVLQVPETKGRTLQEVQEIMQGTVGVSSGERERLAPLGQPMSDRGDGVGR